MLKLYRIFLAANSKKFIMLDSEFNVNTSLHCHRNNSLPTWNCHASCYNKKAVSLTRTFQISCTRQQANITNPLGKGNQKTPVKTMTIQLLYICVYIYICIKWRRVRANHLISSNIIKCRTGNPVGLSFEEFSKWVV